MKQVKAILKDTIIVSLVCLTPVLATFANSNINLQNEKAIETEQLQTELQKDESE